MTLNKTDRIVITLGTQIVGANTFPVRRCRQRLNCVRSLKPRATSSGKCSAR
jgi:hypothetical protein